MKDSVKKGQKAYIIYNDFYQTISAKVIGI